MSTLSLSYLNFAKIYAHGYHNCKCFEAINHEKMKKYYELESIYINQVIILKCKMNKTNQLYMLPRLRRLPPILGNSWRISMNLH